jgi:transposase InsO family protein
VLRSVGSKGDSYDNAAAESLNGLYETELIRRRGPWRGFDDVKLATMEHVDWFNHYRAPQPLQLVADHPVGRAGGA